MMRTSVLCIGILLIFLTLQFNGCEELENLNEPNYITVTITADATVYTTTEHANVLTPNVTVILEMIKDGGENYVFYKTTQDSGTTDKATCSFQLYKEQDIVCYAQPTGVGAGANRIKKTLTWETVDAAADFGGTYSWNVHHDLYLSSGSEP